MLCVRIIPVLIPFAVMSVIRAGLIKIPFFNTIVWDFSKIFCKNKYLKELGQKQNFAKVFASLRSIPVV